MAAHNEKLIFEMNLPNWLNKDDIEGSIQKYLKDDSIRITDMVSQNAVPVGDNFTSDLFRTKIKYSTDKNTDEEQEMSLIIKCTGDTAMKQDAANNLKIFDVETEMFRTILPKLNEILEGDNISADTLLATLEPFGVIILRDLAPLGYKMVNRIKGLDMEHSLIVLKKLAQMHAASAVLHEKEPNLLVSYSKGLITNQTDVEAIKKLVTFGFYSLINIASKWPGCEKYAAKLSAMMDNIFKRSMEVGMRTPGQFSVLNHGDLWTNNLLFLYDSEGKIKDLKFIDFQFSIFTSPAVDLHYFFTTSLEMDIAKNNIPELINYYYEQLVENLKKLNYPSEKLPTHQQIMDDFRARGFYAVATAAAILPLLRAPSRGDARIDEFAKNNDNDAETAFRIACFTCDNYRHAMEMKFPVFDELGLLD